MNYSIKHLFHIDAPISEVFESISTIKGLSQWWTVETTGTSTLGESITFNFGAHQGPTMKVAGFEKNSKIIWECTDSSHGWVGHTFIFSLDENEGKTRVRFSHNGWDKQGDFYALCSFSWGRYMESLRQLCQTGMGEAFGSEGYRS